MSSRIYPKRIINSLFKIFLLIYVSLCSTNPFAMHLPKSHHTPGGIIKIKLPIISHKAPDVFYRDHRVLVIPGGKPQTWRAIVGISVLAKNPRQFIEIQQPKQRVKFYIRRASVPVTHISLNSNSEDTDETDNDKKVKADFRKLVAEWSEGDPFKVKYTTPIEGKFTHFTLQRIATNGTSISHTGLKIKAANNSDVYPTGPGIVLATGNYLYLGKTVLVDHGKGVISIYAHLSEIKVRKGRHLSRNSILGLVGQSDQSSEPSLYWTMIMNQEEVDPKLFL